MVKPMKDKTRQEKQSIEPLFSFKQKKEDRDKILNQFNLDKKEPINKNDIHDVLLDKTREYKDLPKAQQEVVKKEIQLEILYNYPTSESKKKKNNFGKVILFIMGLILIAIIIFVIIKSTH